MTRGRGRGGGRPVHSKGIWRRTLGKYSAPAQRHRWLDDSCLPDADGPCSGPDLAYAPKPVMSESRGDKKSSPQCITPWAARQPTPEVLMGTDPNAATGQPGRPRSRCIVPVSGL